ncbi:PAS domain S-box protein [Candidatus Albibeggiatoa sp. nov. BB20]|uniref:PAS domain S-box protein n=1 Tax=Candidatus Albibeggiatoa sp. nov. BB20 TaxID=3162723 RepID=UPI0033656EDF
MLHYNYQLQKHKLEEMHINKLTTTYQVVVNSYGLVAQTIFNELINRPDVIDIFTQAHDADTQIQKQIREQLYDKLKDSYRRLKQRGLRQLDFHLPNGESFLRFHRPGRYGDNLFPIRYSLQLANLQKIPVQGFEEGSIFHAFRYIYPLFDDSKHIGSVETSASFQAISAEMESIQPLLYHFILDKDVVLHKVHESEQSNYIQSRLSFNYLLDREYARGFRDKLENSHFIDEAAFLEINKLLRPEVEGLLHNGNEFVKTIQLNKKNYVITFLPIKNVAGDFTAYLISYTTDNEFHDLIIRFYWQTIIISFIIFVLVMFIYELHRSRKIIQEHHEKLQKANTDLEQRVRERTVLLDGIMDVQSKFIVNMDSLVAFDHLLDQLLALTFSEYGFIAETLYKKDGSPYLRLIAVTNIAWNEESQNLYAKLETEEGLEFHHLDNLFGQVALTGNIVISNEPMVDPRSTGIPEGHPPVNTFLGLPVYRGSQLIGVIGLANNPIGYSDELIDYLQPILATCASIIEAYKNYQQRIHSDSALQSSEAHIRAIVETAPDGIMTIDEKGLIEMMNPRLSEIFGYSETEILGQNIKLLMPEPYKSRHDEYLQTYCDTGEKHIIGTIREAEGLRKDGTLFPLELAVNELVINNQRKFVGVIRDITQRKRTEAILHDAEQKLIQSLELRLQDLAENIPGIIFQWYQRKNGDSGLYYVSPRCQELYGINQAAFQQNWRIFPVHPEDSLKFEASLQEAVHQIIEWEYEGRLLLEGNVVKWFKGIARPTETSHEIVFNGILLDITAQKQVEEKLQHNEERFELAMLGANDGLWDWDLNEDTVYLSQRWKQMLGYEDDEITDSPQEFYDRVHPNDVEMVQHQVEQYLSKQIEHYEVTLRLLHKDGHYMWILTRGLAVWDEDKPYRFVGTHIDLTEQKHAEQTIVQSEAKLQQAVYELDQFKTTLDMTLDCVLMFESDTLSFIYANQGAIRQLGYEEEEFWQMTPIDLEPATELDEFQQLIEPLLHGDLAALTVQRFYQHKEGHWIPFEVSLQHIQIDEGRRRFVAIARDIRERLQAEEELRKLSTAIEQSASTIVITDLEGNIEFVNPAFEKSTGYSYHEAVGNNPRVLKSGVQTEAIYQDMWDVIKNQGKVWHGELANKRKNDEIYWESVTITPIRSIAGEMTHFLAIKEDITQRKQTEAALQKKNEDLAQALQQLQTTQQELILSEKMAALGQLVAGVAHEVNTPLGAIQSSVQNIIEFLDQNLITLPAFFHDLSQSQQQDLFFEMLKIASRDIPILTTREKRKIRRYLSQQLEEHNIDDAVSVADYLLDIGIHEEVAPFLPILQTADSQSILIKLSQLTQLKTSAKTIATASDRASKVVFALKTYARYDHSGEKIESNIVEGIETVLTLYQNQLKRDTEINRHYADDLPKIWCYPDELNQIWTNLIHNALQAMEYKGILNIYVEQEYQNQLKVSISDTGHGIPEEIIDKIFAPFFTTKPPGEGSGLGLDIVKKIIQKHDGQVDVESTLGQGTTFHIHLPILNQHEDVQTDETQPTT